VGIGGADDDEGPLLRPHSRAELVKWLEAFGVKGFGLGQDIRFFLQPTIEVDDVSHLAAPLPVPVGGAHAFVIGVGLDRAAVVLHADPRGGGLYLWEFRTIDNNANSTWFTETVDVLTAPTVIVPPLIPSGVPAAILRTGQRPAANPIPARSVRLLNANAPETYRPVQPKSSGMYLPPGTFMNWVAEAAGVQALGITVFWQEIPGS